MCQSIKYRSLNEISINQIFIIAQWNLPAVSYPKPNIEIWEEAGVRTGEGSTCRYLYLYLQLFQLSLDLRQKIPPWRCSQVARVVVAAASQGWKCSRPPPCSSPHQLVPTPGHINNISAFQRGRTSSEMDTQKVKVLYMERTFKAPIPNIVAVTREKIPEPKSDGERQKI